MRTPHPPEKSQNIGFLSNFDPGLLKNYNCAKPAFNVGADDGLKWYLDPLSLLKVSKKTTNKKKKNKKKKNVVKVGPPLTKL